VKPHRWEDTKLILEQALQQPPEERSEYVREACGDDERLRQQIERLLFDHERAAGTLEPGAGRGLHGRVREELGEYRLEEVLGGGGMGVVYRAVHKSLGRSAAVKVLRPELSSSRTQVERFQREALATAQLQHRGIVSIQAVGEEDGIHYLAMDYIEGRSLDAVLDELRAADPPAPLEPARWVQIAAEIADALHYAHQRGVVHRDIKPHNILLDQEGYPHLLDFGLAKIAELSSLSRSGVIAGTPHYMSPEQALAKRVEVDHRTDIFSLGVVLYEMLTLQRPFEGENQQQVLYRLSFADPEPLRAHNPRVSHELQTICGKALEKSPDARYATARDFAGDLRRYLADEAILARPPSVLRRARRLLERHPRVPLVTALAVGALLLAGIGWSSLSAYLERPTLTVTSNPSGAEVYLEELDVTGIATSEEVEAGRTPLRGLRLQPGNYRITVVDRDGNFAERVRFLDRPREAYAFDVLIRPTDDVVSDMRLIPSGPAQLGSGAPENSGYYERTLVLPAFLIDEHEVTNRQYEAFVKATRHPAPPLWVDGYPEEAAELPVTGVSYYDARAYAEWAGKRLPTLFEWARAVRGSDGLTDINEVLGEAAANLDHAGSLPLSETGEERWRAAYALYLTAVRPATDPAYRQGPHQLFHVLGNVEEWTDTVVLESLADGSHEPYRSFRVVRGGAWIHPRAEVSLLGNFETPVKLQTHTLGFRCARSLRSPPGDG